jgi:hypothetical protein
MKEIGKTRKRKEKEKEKGKIRKGRGEAFWPSLESNPWPIPGSNRNGMTNLPSFSLTPGLAYQALLSLPPATDRPGPHVSFFLLWENSCLSTAFFSSV